MCKYSLPPYLLLASVHVNTPLLLTCLSVICIVYSKIMQSSFKMTVLHDIAKNTAYHLTSDLGTLLLHSCENLVKSTGMIMLASCL